MWCKGSTSVFGTLSHGSNPTERVFMNNSRQHSSGKGDSLRPVDYKKWSDNWDRIFGKKDKENGKRKRSSVLHRKKKDA